MKPYLRQFSDDVDNINDRLCDIDFKRNAKKIFGKILKKKQYDRNILIFSRLDDPEINYLAPYFIQHDIDYFRVDAEYILKQFKFDYRLTNNEANIILDISGEKIPLVDIDYVWFRHFTLDAVKFPENFNSTDIEYVKKSIMSIINTIINTTDAVVINKTFLEGKVTKPIQLSLANYLNMKIPDTLITNNFKSFNAFLQQKKDIFAKAVDHHSVEACPEVLTAIYGHVIKSDENVFSEDIEISPVIYQTNLNKGIEVRVTVIGHKMFASQYFKTNNEDWHRNDIHQLKMNVATLPENIKDKILQLMRLLKLQMAGIDFLVIGDKWCFLEINPSGDWRWIEVKTNQCISQSVISFIKDSDY